MITLVKTGTGDAPHFFCDHCQMPIVQIELALYLWKQKKRSRGEPEVVSLYHPSILAEQGEIYVLHKQCADAFEAQHGGDQFDWPWMELIDLLLFLMLNGGLTVKDLQKRMSERRELWSSLQHGPKQEHP